MSNGFIYVVDAHFIDKIEKTKSWTQVPVIATGTYFVSSCKSNHHTIQSDEEVSTKAKRMVLQCINGVGSNPVEGRTKI